MSYNLLRYRIGLTPYTSTQQERKPAVRHTPAGTCRMSAQRQACSRHASCAAHTHTHEEMASVCCQHKHKPSCNHGHGTCMRAGAAELRKNTRIQEINWAAPQLHGLIKSQQLPATATLHLHRCGKVISWHKQPGCICIGPTQSSTLRILRLSCCCPQGQSMAAHTAARQLLGF